ncbi:MAG: hypothetical protein IT442_02115, partial [Phycisphaeraceae bacterium]|nr:hypothetical protein [Phycisphaeraceae bacterium]
MALLCPVGSAVLGQTLTPASKQAAPLVATDTVGDGAETSITAPAVLRARKASVWREPVEGGGFSHWIVLEDDVRMQVGAFSFSATRAVVRVDVLHTPGRRIHQLWIDLENAKSGPNAPAVWASAPRLLVTVATTGNVELVADSLTPDRSPSQTAFVQEAAERFTRRRQAMMQPWRELPTTWPSETAMGPTQTPTAVVEAPPLVEPPATITEAAARAETQTTPPPPASVAEIRPEAVASMTTEPAAAATPTTASAVEPVEPIVNPLERAAVTDAQAGQILPASGTLSLSAQRIVFERADAEAGRLAHVALIGDVRLMYQDPASKRNMSLRAENAVIFLADPASAEQATSSLAASGVAGVY